MIIVFRRHRLPACRPLLLPQQQFALTLDKNLETEFLLLPATHHLLPSWQWMTCVPFQLLFVTLRTVVHQAPMFMGFPKQEDCSGVPFPIPGDLMDPEIRCMFPACPALQAYSLSLSPLTVYAAPQQALPSLGFSRQEHWSGLPSPSLIYESETWKWNMKVKSLSCVRLLATPWTTAHQAPLSTGFSRQEYWSRVPLSSV